MLIDLAFRRKAVRSLTSEMGCYVRCDLDQAALYVGQSLACKSSSGLSQK